MQKYSDLIQTLLNQRNIKNSGEAEVFLNPNYERDLYDPFLMKDMEKACVRIFEAIEAEEKIIIYADYDCDGIPGAVILQDLFKKINYSNFEVYIPQRNSEGYGLNFESIKEFSNKNVKLLITVDLGITAINEIVQAEADGINVIITDHHLPLYSLSGEGLTSLRLPKAYAILNPKTDNYPAKMLCGAGVVFKLMQAFVQKYGEYFKISNGWEKWSLDMAGLATLSDMVPLIGENRALAFFGLKVFKKSKRPGLQKLLAKMKIDQKYLSEDDITFMVSPRLNAASRMDDPLRAFELLATQDEKEAGILAEHLSKINENRKLMVANIMREVKKKFEKREMGSVLVIGNPEWRIGVLGLVAGKISDEYDKTVFVWGKDENDCIKGSCRSCGKISVVELMAENKEYFSEFGGHEGAGGFTVINDQIHFLEEALSKTFDKISKGNLEAGEDKNIPQINFNIVQIKNWREIDKLAPFGLENPKPVFLFKNVFIKNIKKFGKNGSGEHLEISFVDDNKREMKGIAFFSGVNSFSTSLEENKKVDLVANFDFSHFRGRDELRLRIIDIL
jgi:single-stranded-DNA-specific exonuclease